MAAKILVIRLMHDGEIVRSFEIPAVDIPFDNANDYWQVQVAVVTSQDILLQSGPLPPWGRY